VIKNLAAGRMRRNTASGLLRSASIKKPLHE
jgi:hypothetical protein